MQTHIWNALDAAAVLEGAPNDDRTYDIAVSLASEDGVYDRADLRHALQESTLPVAQLSPLWAYLNGERDLADLRAHLRGLMDNIPEEEEPTPDVARVLPHHAALALRLDREAAEARIREQQHKRYSVEFELTNLRLTLPAGFDPDDEDAVLRWLRGNWSRVVDAAHDADPQDLYVVDVEELSEPLSPIEASA